MFGADEFGDRGDGLEVLAGQVGGVDGHSELVLDDKQELHDGHRVEADLEALTDLDNHYVLETPLTFDTEPFTPEERRPWLLSHPEAGPHRLRVARDAGSQEILGYATSSPYRA